MLEGGVRREERSATGESRVRLHGVNALDVIPSCDDDVSTIT